MSLNRATQPQRAGTLSQQFHVDCHEPRAAIADSGALDDEIVSMAQHVTDDDVMKMVMKRQSAHQVALSSLIEDAHVGGKLLVQRMKGQPDKMIPQHIVDKDIDILVMGTVARTGIPGFFIGNTAENVLRKLTCTLLAIKPMGFASPVAAY